MKLVIKKAVSKKTGNPYVCLLVDFGWKKSVLTYDNSLIQDCVDCYGQDYAVRIDAMKENQEISISEFKK